MNTMSVAMKNIDFLLDPNPMIKVKSESDMNAQISDPPLSIPVTWAYPIGKASSQPNS